MAMAERPSLHVLTRKPNMITLQQETSESQSFCCAPVDALSLLNALKKRGNARRI